MPGMIPKAKCERCRYRRNYQKPRLFSSRDLQSPGVLAAQMKWEQERRQRTDQERNRVETGFPFFHEPQSYSWCAVFTFLLEEEVDAIKATIKAALATGDTARAGHLLDRAVHYGSERAERAVRGDVMAQELFLEAEPERGQFGADDKFQFEYKLTNLCNPNDDCFLFQPK